MRLDPVPALFAGGALILLTACGEPESQKLAIGAQLYATHCASCHGAKLEGQPNWRQKLANGRMPAPPHDDSGHTWHHSDQWLFHVVENGMTPPLARPGYQSDMPAFKGKLSDGEIRAVLAYIKSHWSVETARKRDEMLANRRSQSRSASAALHRLFDSKD